ncbi:MAG: hypothetical protein GY816_03065 [Cytophagales bacterium]|nr:hypothetical protein [Cytophagales bacterium]
MVNTVGWICVLASIALFFASSGPSPILLLIIGGSIIWLTTKKKIFKIDTDVKELYLDDSHAYSQPEKIIIYLSRESQVVNSRVQTTTVYSSFYMAYFVADGEKHLISKNKKLETDLDALLKLGQELSIEVEQLY